LNNLGTKTNIDKVLVCQVKDMIRAIK
jgi:hypothetical protein